MRRNRTLILVMVVIGTVFVAGAARAQHQVRAFEVVSIKQAVFPSDAYFEGFASAGTCNRARLVISGNRVTLTQASLCGLISLAYDIPGYLIAKAPPWMTKVDRSVFYDIQATAPDAGPLEPDLAVVMLETLLSDRFKLKAHWEMTELQVYDLVVGKSGPKLALSADGPCSKVSSRTTVTSGRGLFASCQPKTTMTQLAETLSRNTDRPVLDKTGLDGGHVFELRWDASGGTGAPSDSLPSLFTAVQELGLKLEANKASGEVLVIDNLERPTAN